MSKLTLSEQFALNEWLSCFPDNLSFEQVMDLLYSSDWTNDDISVWVVVEDCTLPQVAEFIRNTKIHFENVTKGLFK